MISEKTFKKMGLLVVMLISFALAITFYFNTYVSISCFILFWFCAYRLTVKMIEEDLNEYENKIFFNNLKR